MNNILCQLRTHIRIMADHQRERRTGQLLIKAADEIERLLRGDFTEEEFQNLCHNFSEQDAERFKHECIEYQKKLFGG